MTVDVGDDRLRRLLEYDPLREADAEAAVSGADPTALSFFNVHASMAAKQEVLARRDDTFWACPLDYFLAIVDAEGFALLDERPDESDETFPGYVERFHWHPRDAILLHSSSYARRGDEAPRIDGASMIFNCLVPFGCWEKLRGAPGSQSPVKLPSGEEYACRYTLDGREAMRFGLRLLRTHGAFVDPWIYAPSHSPLAYHREWERTRRTGEDGLVSFDLLVESGRRASDARLLEVPEAVRRCLSVCGEARR